MILGRYAGLDPRALVFMYGLRGKPVFAQVDLEGLKFNLAHSGEMALIGVTLYRDIGVDLEEIHSLYDAPRIAERFFSPRESAALRAFPEAERLEAFFRCWTLKEAYLKATGDGLARAIDSFDVTFARGDSPRLRSAEGKPEELWRWSLVQLAPAPGYVGAVAVEGHGWTMTCWQDYAQQI
jgi:4'-phosphopantetheinyl transferase